MSEIISCHNTLWRNFDIPQYFLDLFISWFKKCIVFSGWGWGGVGWGGGVGVYVYNKSEIVIPILKQNQDQKHMVKQISVEKALYETIKSITDRFRECFKLAVWDSIYLCHMARLKTEDLWITFLGPLLLLLINFNPNMDGISTVQPVKFGSREIRSPTL